MTEPKAMIAPPRQPIGWPTHRFQHSLKTVMPSASTGSNMTIHRDIPKELLPFSRYNKIPERWRTQLPPIQKHQMAEHRQTDNSGMSTKQSAHLEVRPPSAYSATIVLKPRTGAEYWTVNRKLNVERVKNLIKENTFLPGNFSTLYRCSKEKVQNMVNRLSYDPYERREQLMLADNPEGDTDDRMYSKADVDIIVARLATVKSAPAPEPTPEKKPVSKELSAKEKEIVDRLSKYEHPANKTSEEQEVQKKTVTTKELEVILGRLTKYEARKEPVVQQVEVKKVSAVDLDNILSRLTTYDAQKWPPESKPEIFRAHASSD
ncbi:hypothetical protein EB796_001650 [Bugula neritina]|uniref:Uncharacterized protein n=1 Tax=Bugula neritina TaxID=10212 RepID=A0A7J7KPN8_BUGNE|nr:hypothetical protein EB796_001650 [Bugula neritina]